MHIGHVLRCACTTPDCGHDLMVRLFVDRSDGFVWINVRVGHGLAAGAWMGERDDVKLLRDLLNEALNEVENVTKPADEFKKKPRALLIRGKETGDERQRPQA